IWIKITSLGFTKSRITSDEKIQQLCVECRLKNFPAEDTPLSLPKPTGGQRIHCNDSTVDFQPFLKIKYLLFCVCVCVFTLKFTVLSDAPEDEQDPECEDTDFALVRLKEIFWKQRNIIEQDIDVFDSQDDSAVIGKLKRTAEALHVLPSVKEGMQR
ncbi:FTM protein, partial [Ptilonorhynchus violaceus]|nr:FTM protein [Ptilonorhynchus violaceus]